MAATHTAATGVSASNSFFFMTFPFVIRPVAFAAGPIPPPAPTQLLGNVRPSIVPAGSSPKPQRIGTQNWRASDIPLSYKLTAARFGGVRGGTVRRWAQSANV